MLLPPESRDVRISRPERIRQFVQDGELWTAWESPAEAVDGRAPELVLESRDMIRRVRDRPAGWFTLSVSSLFALGRGSAEEPVER
jgi:hypothetical protein